MYIHLTNLPGYVTNLADFTACTSLERIDFLGLQLRLRTGERK
jgi:hypothetical protein